MNDKEQRPTRVLRNAFRYVGVCTGAVMTLGKGIGHACESGVKATGSLFVPRREKAEEGPTVAAEPIAEAPEHASSEERVSMEPIPEQKQETKADADTQEAEASDAGIAEGVPSSS